MTILHRGKSLCELKQVSREFFHVLRTEYIRSKSGNNSILLDPRVLPDSSNKITYFNSLSNES